MRTLILFLIFIPQVVFGQQAEVNESAKTHHSQGVAWAEQGDFYNAIKDFDEAIRLNPKYTATYNIRGASWADQGEHDKAIKDFTEVIKLNPKVMSAYFNRGHIRAERGTDTRSGVVISRALIDV